MTKKGDATQPSPARRPPHILEVAERLNQERAARIAAVTLVKALDQELAYWKGRCEAFHRYIMATQELLVYEGEHEDEDLDNDNQHTILWDAKHGAMDVCLTYLARDARGG